MLSAILCTTLIFWSCCLSYAEVKNVCGPPPVVDKATVSGPLQDNYAVNTELIYSCELGYVVTGTKRSTKCVEVRNSEGPKLMWTLPNITCSARSCGDPGYVEHAYRNGSVFTFPNSIVFKCEKGYKIKGLPTRYCKPNGQWSGRLPSCERIFCHAPENPANGAVIYVSLEYGSELRYTCAEGFLLESKGKRFCSEDGSWSGEEPICTERKCGDPKPPEHGSVNIIKSTSDTATFAVFSCEEGRTLVGSKVSKCLSTGEWTFYTPLCVEPCKVPYLSHGKMFAAKQNRRRTEFKQVQAGTIHDDGTELHLRCDSNYEPAGLLVDELKISCIDRQWSVEPQCLPRSCRSDPPAVQNAQAVATNKSHGATVLYSCNSEHFQKIPGNITCHFGSWMGNKPICKDTRCYASSLNLHGVKFTERSIFLDQEALEFECGNGYVESKRENRKIFCDSGEWKIGFLPCVAASCEGPPPKPNNVKIMHYFGLHATSVTYECSTWYYLQETSKVQCLFGSWTGDTPECLDSRCYINQLHQKEGVDLSFADPVASGNYADIQCMDGYSLKYEKPKCHNGKWELENNYSPCQPSLCEVPYIENGEMKHLEMVKIKSSFFKKKVETEQYTKANIGSKYSTGYVLYVFCTPPHIFQGKHEQEANRIVCSYGRWNQQPICLKPGAQQNTGNHFPVVTNFVNRSSITETKTIEEIMPTTHIARSSPSPSEEKDDATSSVSSFANVTNFKEGSVVSKNGSENTKEESSNFKNDTGCACVYSLLDENVVAYVGNTTVNFKDKIREGCILNFRCNHVGYDVLRGSSSLECSGIQNCFWHSSMFPSCTHPNDGDAFIHVEIQNYPKSVHSSGYLMIPPRANVIFSCGIRNGKMYPNWNAPQLYHPINYALDDGLYTYFTIYKITEKFNGKYTCHGDRGKNSNYVEIKVEEISCPEMHPNDVVEIEYEGDRKVGSVMKFYCKQPERRLASNEHATCQPNGKWIYETPKCEIVQCPIESLFDVLPESVAFNLENATLQYLPYNTKIQLMCDQDNQHILGNSTAVCGSTGKWIVSQIQCVSGCGEITQPFSPQIVIKPRKEIYRFGEYVTLSCPPGQKLTTDVQVLMCLNNGWSESILPNCTNVAETGEIN